MKKHLALVAAVAVLSSSAYATKARLGALGQGRDGSYYISDTRNVFYNPSAIVDMNKYVVAELGEANNGGAQGGNVRASTTVDRWTAPNAEGGFFGSMGRVAYGVYLGFQDAEANGACRNNVYSNTAAGAIVDDLPVLGCVGRPITVAAGVPNAAAVDFLGQDNRVDLFVGGDQFLKWGLGYYWASSTDQVLGTGTATTTLGRASDTNGARLGLEWNNLKYWLNVTWKDVATIASAKTALNEGAKPEQVYSGKSNWSTGLSWTHKMWTVYWNSELKEATIDQNDAAATSGAMVHTRAARQQHKIGVGYQKAVNSKATLLANLDLVFSNARFIRSPSTSITAGAGVLIDAGMSGWALPLNVGFETEVFSWLTARATVSQNLAALNHEFRNEHSGTTNYLKSGVRLRPLGSTDVNAGATLEFGKLKVDGLVGTTVAGGGPSTATRRGVLALDQLLTRVGASYWF